MSHRHSVCTRFLFLLNKRLYNISAQVQFLLYKRLYNISAQVQFLLYTAIYICICSIPAVQRAIYICIGSLVSVQKAIHLHRFTYLPNKRLYICRGPIPAEQWICYTGSIPAEEALMCAQQRAIYICTQLQFLTDHSSTCTEFQSKEWKLECAFDDLECGIVM